MASAHQVQAPPIRRLAAPPTSGKGTRAGIDERGGRFHGAGPATPRPSNPPPKEERRALPGAAASVEEGLWRRVGDSNLRPLEASPSSESGGSVSSGPMVPGPSLSPTAAAFERSLSGRVLARGRKGPLWGFESLELSSWVDGKKGPCGPFRGIFMERETGFEPTPARSLAAVGGRKASTHQVQASPIRRLAAPPTSGKGTRAGIDERGGRFHGAGPATPRPSNPPPKEERRALPGAAASVEEGLWRRVGDSNLRPLEASPSSESGGSVSSGPMVPGPSLSPTAAAFERSLSGRVLARGRKGPLWGFESLELSSWVDGKKGPCGPFRGIFMERETGFEPATPTLARLCSTS